MTRKAHLEPHLSNDELKSRYLSSKDPVEGRIYHLLWLVSKKRSIKQAAEIMSYNYDYAQEIVKRYNHEGEKSVANGQKKGKERPSNALLDKNQLGELKETLKTPPEDGGLWSGPKVARWIERKTGRKKVWNQRGWDYLKKCRYSQQMPRRKHRKGDPIKQAVFKYNLAQRVQGTQKRISSCSDRSGGDLMNIVLDLNQ